MKDINELTLIKRRLQQGIWEGVLQGADVQPKIAVLHLDKPIPDVQITEMDDGWLLQFPIPVDAIADGVHTLVISHADTGEALGSETFIAGDVLGDDIRAEMDLLRAELDMLKRAFRRHCAETS